MDQLLTQLEEDKLFRANMQTANEQLKNTVKELVAKNEKQEEKIDLLLVQTAQHKEEIRILQDQIDIIKPKSADHQFDRADVLHKTTNAMARSAPPSSCRQLSTIGHYLDGLYLVANPDTNKIETVYCDFASSTRKYTLSKKMNFFKFLYQLLFLVSETVYGNVDVKTTSIHFFVQRSTYFNLTNTVISFDIEWLNEGEAMNLATGIFTVPLDGIYHFQFSALKAVDTSANTFVFLQVNGVHISASYAPSELTPYLSLSVIHASLRLKTGDQVCLYKTTVVSSQTDLINILNLRVGLLKKI